MATDHGESEGFSPFDSPGACPVPFIEQRQWLTFQNNQNSYILHRTRKQTSTLLRLLSFHPLAIANPQSRSALPQNHHRHAYSDTRGRKSHGFIQPQRQSCRRHGCIRTKGHGHRGSSRVCRDGSRRRSHVLFARRRRREERPRPTGEVWSQVQGVQVQRWGLR